MQANGKPLASSTYTWTTTLTNIEALRHGRSPASTCSLAMCQNTKSRKEHERANNGERKGNRIRRPTKSETTTYGDTYTLMCKTPTASKRGQRRTPAVSEILPLGHSFAGAGASHETLMCVPAAGSFTGAGRRVPTRAWRCSLLTVGSWRCLAFILGGASTSPERLVCN